MIDEYPVTVCSECHRASCWQGIFLCDKAREAGTVELMVADLHSLGIENPEYWFKSPQTGAIDQSALARYRAAFTTTAGGGS